MIFKFNWIGTGFVLLGIILTNINFYPLNIFLHGFGVLMWTIHGFILKDKAILTNFGFQVPIFIFGISSYLLN